MTNVSETITALFSKMESFVSTKTVVGEAIHVGNVVLLPLVDVSVGVGAGGGDISEKSGATGGGLGAKITPSAVIVIADGNVQLVNVKNQDSINKLIDMAPGLISKLNLGSLFNKKKDEKEEIEE